MDVAKAIGPECEHRIIGIRPGEKIHEEMITSSDSYNTYDLGKYYVILPTVTSWKLENYKFAFNAQKVENGFSYTSGENKEWETVESLKELINKHVSSIIEI